MIKYTLKCDQEHSFDSWFDGTAAYEKLEAAGLLECAICGSSNISRGIMAPQVSPARNKAHQPLTTPASDQEQKIAELRKNVEANSENVGDNFAQEARAIHEGDAPARSIIGEAKVDDAKKLIDDGIPVLPLPWGRKRTN
jgi:hypothetical protein